jgi:anti-sigma factor RsiW
MSHQPFEDWLFTNEPLESQQKQALQDHLEKCEHCQALSSALNKVEEVFEASPIPVPAPGFTQRWYEKLIVARGQEQSRRTWRMVLIFFSAATVIIIALTLLNLNSINWAYQLSQFIANFSLFAGKVNRFWRFFQSLSNAFPVIIPITVILGIGLASLTTVLFITWFSSLIKIYKPVEKGV